MGKNLAMIVALLFGVLLSSCNRKGETVEPNTTANATASVGSLPLDNISQRIDTSHAGWKKNHLLVWKDSTVTFDSIRSRIKTICSGSLSGELDKFLMDPDNYKSPTKIYSGTATVWLTRQTQILDSMKKTFKSIKLSPLQTTSIYNAFTKWVSDSLIAGAEIDLMRAWINNPQKWHGCSYRHRHDEHFVRLYAEALLPKRWRVVTG